MSILIELSCPDHPRYQAKRKPRVRCKACHDAWTMLQAACTTGYVDFGKVRASVKPRRRT